MLGFIRPLHGGVRFSYVPYVVHPFISRYSPVTTRRYVCSSSVYYMVLSVIHQFFSVHYPFIIRYFLENFAKFGTVYERVRTYEVNFTRYSSVSAYSLMCDRGISTFFGFFSQITTRICLKFCVDVPQVDPYQVCYNWVGTPIFHGIMGNFVQFLASS